MSITFNAATKDEAAKEIAISAESAELKTAVSAALLLLPDGRTHYRGTARVDHESVHIDLHAA